MEIQINNQTRVFIAAASLQEIMEQEGFAAMPGIAVALNDTVCPKDEWTKTKVQDGALITIIKASQGG
jgi:sulfur carrier protein